MLEETGCDLDIDVDETAAAAAAAAAAADIAAVGDVIPCINSFSMAGNLAIAAAAVLLLSMKPAVGGSKLWPMYEYIPGYLAMFGRE